MGAKRPERLVYFLIIRKSAFSANPHSYECLKGWVSVKLRFIVYYPKICIRISTWMCFAMILKILFSPGGIFFTTISALEGHLTFLSMHNTPRWFYSIHLVFLIFSGLQKEKITSAKKNNHINLSKASNLQL